MSDQSGGHPVEVHREEPGALLGEVPFYGILRNCTGAHYFQ